MSGWQPQQYDPQAHRQRAGSAPPPQQAPWQQYQQAPQGQPQYTPPRQPPAVRAAPVQRAKPKKDRRGLIGCATFLVFALTIGVIYAVTSGGGSSGSFKATVENYAEIDPGDLAVTVQVTNTGKTAATPTCTVNAGDASGAYSGFDEETLTRPVQPGQTVTYVDNVTITGNGAQYVTQAGVSC